MELENILLNEVTQTQKACTVFAHSWEDISHKVHDSADLIHRPNEAKQSKILKREYLNLT